jgi:hypothetical protein
MTEPTNPTEATKSEPSVTRRAALDGMVLGAMSVEIPTWVPRSVQVWTSMEHKAVNDGHQVQCSCGWSGVDFDRHFLRELRHRAHLDGDCLGQPDCGWCIGERIYRERARVNRASRSIRGETRELVIGIAQLLLLVVERFPKVFRRPLRRSKTTA